MRMRTLCCLLLLLLPFPCLAAYISTAKQGMVVSEHELASEIGADILRKGGNAIDAAVAVGYALAVVTPCCGNIGGGGFMLIHLQDGKNVFLNFREKASENANPNMYFDKNGKPLPSEALKGYLAVAVPGTVLGFDTALQKYGTMKRSDVMAPAIQLAQKGYLVSKYQAKLFARFTQDFRRQPNVSAIFLKDGEPYQAGDRLIQKDLANSLQLIADQGPRAFYEGPIAQTIVAESKAHGGILTLADFANYNVEELTPIYCSYRGYDIVSAPPPSSGGVTLCEMLNILENFPLKQLGYHSKRGLTYIIEAMHYGYLDRNNKLGDPNFIKNPTEQLTSKSYARTISEKIRREDLLSPLIPALQEPTQTTHFSVIDDKGNAVSTTFTLNGWFGAGVIAGNTGFFLNNEMDDFSAGANVPNQYGLLQSDTNNIQPGKRPLSSMTPTLISKNGHLFLVIGSPGGPRIITSVLLATLNIIDYGMSAQEAVDAPRFHYQVTPNVIFIEPLALSFQKQKELELEGYHFLTEDRWSAVEAILVNPIDNAVYGASDDRRPDGKAVHE